MYFTTRSGAGSFSDMNVIHPHKHGEEDCGNTKGSANELLFHFEFPLEFERELRTSLSPASFLRFCSAR